MSFTMDVSLATELFDISPTLMKEAFRLNQNSVYNAQNKRTILSRRVSAFKYGTESIAFLAPKTWKLLGRHTTSLGRHL